MIRGFLIAALAAGLVACESPGAGSPESGGAGFAPDAHKPKPYIRAPAPVPPVGGIEI